MTSLLLVARWSRVLTAVLCTALNRWLSAFPRGRLHTSNFEHGMSVYVGSETCQVHAPRWWQVVAHVRWILARARRRTRRLTMSDGEMVRLISHD